MRDTNGYEEHLRPEELDAIALESGRALPARGSAHVAACERCQDEVGDLRRLHVALLALASFGPRAGLADRVMHRVTLPLPWRKSALITLREHRAATAAALAGFMAALGFGLTATARYPELTPIAVAAFLYERFIALAWGAVMYVGQLVYRTGLMAAAEGAAEQVTLVTGFLAVATVTFVGLGALRIMLSLMNTSPGARPATGR